MTVGTPSSTVWRTRPRSWRPANGVLWLRLASLAGTTSHDSCGIEHDEVRPPAGDDRSAVAIGDAGDRRRTPRHRRQDVLDGHPRVAEDRQADAQRCLQPDHARRGLVERLFLDRRRVRRVIRGDGVDGPVDDALDERLDVCLGAQRRVDLEHRVVAAELLVGERQVVGGDLGGHRDALRLGATNELDAARGRHMQEVDASAGQT